MRSLIRALFALVFLLGIGSCFRGCKAIPDKNFEEVSRVSGVVVDYGYVMDRNYTYTQFKLKDRVILVSGKYELVLGTHITLVRYSDGSSQLFQGETPNVKTLTPQEKRDAAKGNRWQSIGFLLLVVGFFGFNISAPEY